MTAAAPCPPVHGPPGLRQEGIERLGVVALALANMLVPGEEGGVFPWDRVPSQCSSFTSPLPPPFTADRRQEDPGREVPGRGGGAEAGGPEAQGEGGPDAGPAPAGESWAAASPPRCPVTTADLGPRACGTTSCVGAQHRAAPGAGLGARVPGLVHRTNVQCRKARRGTLTPGTLGRPGRVSFSVSPPPTASLSTACLLAGRRSRSSRS